MPRTEPAEYEFPKWDTRHVLVITEQVIETDPGNPETITDYVACILQLSDVHVTVEGPNGEDRQRFQRTNKSCNSPTFQP